MPKAVTGIGQIALEHAADVRRERGLGKTLTRQVETSRKPAETIPSAKFAIAGKRPLFAGRGSGASLAGKPDHFAVIALGVGLARSLVQLGKAATGGLRQFPVRRIPEALGDISDRPIENVGQFDDEIQLRIATDWNEFRWISSERFCQFASGPVSIHLSEFY